MSEITAVHETAGFSSCLLDITDRNNIPGFAALASACHRHGTKIFAQLFHPGREILSAYGGMLPVAYAPSAVPNERFHIMPTPMSPALIRDVVAGYALSARHLAEAGYDGVEIVASHGYLPAQFLNPRVNRREDEYGGNEARRLRFLTDVVSAIRAECGELVVGVRISGAELDSDGLTLDEVVVACRALDTQLDYFSVVAGTSASLGGSVHIVPPMGLDETSVTPVGAEVKGTVTRPVIVTGRINQPQIAERIIADGAADLCGMARALICDPRFPVKARAGDSDDIRACIACNQACIGRAHKGLGVSCIQHPESGRELEFGALPAIQEERRVAVVGGGPAGMKAAAVAAARGHEVTLYERSRWLGGQALLAQRLPGREEFGGIVDNLKREMEQAGVEVIIGKAVSGDDLARSGCDLVVLATGAQPRVPEFDHMDGRSTWNAWEVLQGNADIGQSVVIADWRADWIGLGLAERFMRDGHTVTLCVNAAMAARACRSIPAITMSAGCMIWVSTSAPTCVCSAATRTRYISRIP